MGVSTNAILAFGFDLGELNEHDWQEALAVKLDDYDDDIEAFLLDQYGVELQRGEKLCRNKVPVDIIQHCSYECPMYFLSIRGTQQTARRGYPTDIGLCKPMAPDRVQALRDFCAKHSIPWQEPSWYIFSMWA
jgi:hypothetical protein